MDSCLGRKADSPLYWLREGRDFISCCYSDKLTWVLGRNRDATLARASRREQLSRVGRINGDRIERLSVARLTIEDLSDGMRAYEMKVWQMSRFGTSTACCVRR